VGHHLFAADYEQGAFGAHLVRMLAEKLEADIEVTDADGTSVVLRIRNFKLA
jgi:two-component sensor histidine kinase